MIVIKVGGNELDDDYFLASLAQQVAALPEWPLIVHGGGRATSELMTRFGLVPRFVEGLRVTDPQTLDLVIMALVGQASTRLVAALAHAGVPAIGLSGVDAGLVTARPIRGYSSDLGAVGEPVTVDGARLQALRRAGFLPCIAPICRDERGGLLNVNADSVAQSVAVEVGADMLVFLTNMPAVIIEGRVVELITAQAVEWEIARGEISGGMIPKARSAVAAIEAGVARVLITNLEGLGRVTQGGRAGTMLVPELAESGVWHKV
jgi:acetylglutamate kinase